MSPKMKVASLALVLVLLLMEDAAGHVLLEPGQSQTKVRPSLAYENMRQYLGLYQTGLSQSSSMHPTTNSSQDSPRSVSAYNCTQNGFFAMNGSCSDYYQCQFLYGNSEYRLYLHTCSPGTLFDDIWNLCYLPAEVKSRPDCISETPTSSAAASPGEVSLFGLPFHNKPRFYNSSDESNANDFPSGRNKALKLLVYSTEFLNRPFSLDSAESLAAFFFPRSENGRNSWTDLKCLENQLIGIMGKLHNISLEELESQISSEISSNINLILSEATVCDNLNNFEFTEKLNNGIILRTLLKETKIRGLVSDSSLDSSLNKIKAFVTLEALRHFTHSEIRRAQLAVRKGYGILVRPSERELTEVTTNKLSYFVTDLIQRSNFLEGLPEHDRESEIERNGGYAKLQQNRTLPNLLYELINQNLSIAVNDKYSTALVDLLLQGLQIHANILSFVISANVYLTRKTLARRSLDEFNACLLRVAAAVDRMKSDFGFQGSSGLIAKVKAMLKRQEEQALINGLEIKNIQGFVSMKIDSLTALEANINNILSENLVLNDPETIPHDPDFITFVDAPLGSWVNGQKVSYAIHFASTDGVSKVGKWSLPYTVEDKACPTIHIPQTDYGVRRFVYRRFNLEVSELVAIITDETVTTFRDISRDLINAVSQTDEEQAVKESKVLLNKGANVNSTLDNGMMAIHYAAKFGNLEVMKLLINKSANANELSTNNFTAIHFAAENGADKAVTYLLSHGANVNSQTHPLQVTPLHLAAEIGHANVVRALIAGGAFINIKDRNGLTPLHYCIVGSGSALELLLNNEHLDINGVTKEGMTPLHFAIRCNKSDFAKKLLHKSDTRVNSPSNDLLTPLHLAAISGNAILTESLIGYGALVSASDRYGSTPLHYAAFYGNSDAAMVLMNSNISIVNSRNYNNETALDLALEHKRENVFKILSRNLKILTTDPSKNLNSDVDIDFQDITEVPMSDKDTEISCPLKYKHNNITNLADMCLHTRNIDSYVNLVVVHIPLKINEAHLEYASIIKTYDTDLEIAKNHTKIWRDGDSIVNGISQTFKLAEKFDPEFRRKFEINQRRVSFIIQNSGKLKAADETKKQIRYLERNISRFETKLQSAEFPEIKDFLNSTLHDLRNKLTQMQSLLDSEDIDMTEELEELRYFLEFILQDSDKINTTATETIRKTEIFRDNLARDKGAFERHARITGENIPRVENISITNTNELNRIKLEQEQLSKQVEEEKIIFRSLHRKLNHSKALLHDLYIQLERNQQTLSNKKTWSSYFRLFNGFVMVSPETNFATPVERKQITWLEENIDRHENMGALVKYQIREKERKVEALQEEMYYKHNSSLNLKVQRNYLSTLDSDLKDIASKLNTLIPIIDKAILSVRGVKDIFEYVTLTLREMIDMAHMTKTETEKRNIRFFIYHELSSLQCQWREVYLETKRVNKCI